LLRQQQVQRQQEQQHRVAVQQVSPPSTSHQQQYRSTGAFSGGQQVSPTQQGRGRTESERQRQDEQGILFSNSLTNFSVDSSV